VTTRGGKSRGSTSAGTILAPCEAFSEEALAPLAHDRTWHVETLSDHLVLEALGGEQYDLGAYYVSIR
jgi:hypothetical protein